MSCQQKTYYNHCNPCKIPKLINCYSDKVCIYTSDNYIPLPTWRSPPAPPVNEWIVPMMLGPPNSCGKPTPVPMPQPLNPASFYCEWKKSNETSQNNKAQSKMCGSSPNCCSQCAGH